MEAGTGTSHIDGIAEEQGRGPEAINSILQAIQSTARS